MKKKFILPALLSALFIGAGVNSSVDEVNANNHEEVVEVSNNVNHDHNIQVKRAAETSGDETSNSHMKEMTEDEIAAKEVDDMIEAIGDVTLESRESIKEAKAAYEELTYNQQKLVENVSDLEEAIADYNKLIEDDEDVKAIETLQHKTMFTDVMEENKGLRTVMIVLGTVTGLGLIYLAYLGIKKLKKFFR